MSDNDQLIAPKKTRNWGARLFFYLIMIPALLFSAYTWITLQYVYAEGDRTGFVQKISKKGWLFKTWEGELAMVNLPGTVPEIFNFSVRSDQVAADIQKSMGQRVVLNYEQHRGIPVNWFAESQHFIVSVVPVAGDMPIPPAK